jgi:hypothetical protein
MERCNELCTKEATGQCALCDTLAERDRFIQKWFKGGWFSEVKNAVAPSVNKGWRWFQSHSLLIYLVIGCLTFVFFFVRALWIHIDQSTVCQSHFGKLEERNCYLEIGLAEQHPIAPYFSGNLFFISVDPNNAGVSTVTVTRPGKRSLGHSQHDIKTIWDTSWKALRPQAPEVFDLIAETRSHQSFPFDSARFDSALDLDPPIDFKVIRIANRVPGFVMNCREMFVTRPNSRTLHIKFGLHRSPFVQLYTVTLTLASIVFLLLIIRITQFTSLATAMASFFLSLCSLPDTFSRRCRIST